MSRPKLRHVGSGSAGSERPRVFYSVAEVADLFGMSDMTLYRAINEGQFPAVRVRGRLFVPAKAIESMVESAVGSGALVDAAAWNTGVGA
jgi:excisionase family DNA binding protein